MIPEFGRLLRVVVFTLAATVALVAGLACGNQDEDTPLIFAAASLADALTEAAEAYEAATGDAVEFNFGGSNALANQIARLNAPADGVILAGRSPLALLADDEKVDLADVVMIAENSLVVVSADDKELDSLDDLSSSDQRVAIADPEFAPAGEYAKEALVSAAVWDDLSERMIPTLDVRAALAAASSRSVGFAIVYATDARTESDLNVVLEIDNALHQPVTYPAAAIKDSSVAIATNTFLEFLLGPGGQEILRSHGFTGN